MPASSTTSAQAAESSSTSAIEGMHRVTNIRRTALVVVMGLAAAAAVAASPQQSARRLARGTPPVTMQAGALARLVSEMAGYSGTVPRVRNLRGGDADALVVQADSRVRPNGRDRNRP